MEFEAVLATFDTKSDEQRAYESFVKANEMGKELNQGNKFTEEMLRDLMSLYLDAFWVYGEMREEIALNIHQIGKLLEEEYQCQYFFDDEKKKYYTMCPAMLLHSDFGFSMRASEKYKCSICGLSILDCEHITGNFYDDVECKMIDRRCNICGNENCKCHIPGTRYNEVQAVKVVYDINLVTFDIVEDPEMKFSRMSKVYFSEEEVRKDLVDSENCEFVFGKTKLYCHHCSQCKGYIPKRFHHLFTEKMKQFDYRYI